MKVWRLAVFIGLVMWSALASAEITLFALFKDKAILHIDGNRRVLTVGSVSPEGVKLVSTFTTSEEAVVEKDGKQQTLKLGVVLGAFQTTTRESVTLYADRSGFFHADGSINGHPVRFLVDTGANTVAINAALAKRVGIDYLKGQPGMARTASGYARVYGVTLNLVKVGDIEVHNVQAGVIEGSQPEVPLLGMSFLSPLDMKREGNRMELTRRY